MTNTVVANIVEGKLPPDFWRLPEFEGQPWLKDLHVELSQRLQQEAPDADVLEVLMMERVAFLYIYMRSVEVKEGFSYNRDYTDMLRTWVSMAADLRKQRQRVEELQHLRVAIVGEVARALKEGLKDVDPELARNIQSRVISLVAV